jgi:hypothetical protein
MMCRLLSIRRVLSVVLFGALVVAMVGFLVAQVPVKAQENVTLNFGPGEIHPTWPISYPIIIIPYPGHPYLPYFPCYGPGSLPVPPPPGVPTPLPQPTPTPGPATALNYRVCPQLANRVPASVQQDAMAAPYRYYGYALLQNPNVPFHPVWNVYRTWLTLLDYGKPWSPCNPVVWKSGCP